MIGTVLQDPFRDTNFALVSWLFLWPLATCKGESSGPADGSPAFRVGAVERGGELSSTLDTSHLWMCYWACLRVLLWWFGWRGDQSLGWETLGGLGPGQASRGLMAWGDFWCARSYAQSCFLFYLYDIINLKTLFTGSF